MAASDARPVPRKNTAFRLYFAIRKSDGTLITSWTGADSEVSLDGGSFSDCTNEATEIGTTGCGYIDFTSGEMNADAVVYKLTVTNTGALPLVFTLFPEELGDYRSDVGMISGDSSAADNAEAFFDGTGYAGTNNVIPTVTSVTNRVTANTDQWNGTSVTTATVRSDLINIAGVAVSTSTAQLGVNVVNAGGTAWGSGAITAGAIAASAITAAKFNVGAIDGTAIATSAVTKIANGVLDDALSGHATAGTVGKAVSDILDYTGTIGVVVAAGSKTGYTLSSAGVDAIWDEDLTGHATSDTAGAVVTGTNTNVSALITTVGVAGVGLTEAGGTGDHLTAIPWNAAWDAEVQSEVQDAIVVNGLDHLLAASVTGTDITDNSIVARLASKSATADWDSFNNTTDSLEAIRDRGDAAWTGGGGGGSVVISPIAGNAPDRVTETTLKAFVGETWSEQVGGVDADGDVIDFTALGDLKFILEDRNGTDVLVIANADITKASTYFQVSIDDQYIGDVPKVMRWSLRQVSNNNVVLYGPFIVGDAADAD